MFRPLVAVPDTDGVSAYATQIISLTIHTPVMVAPGDAEPARLEMQVRGERAVISLSADALIHLTKAFRAACDRAGLSS
jgi:hypothetical protein